MSAKTIASAVNDFVEKRRSEREKVRLPAKITFGGKTFVLDCTIRDLSEHGARVAVADPDVLPKAIVLIEPKNLIAFEATIKWRRGKLVGLSFDTAIFLEGQLEPGQRVLRMYARNARKEWG
jgi:hypothetical protein